MTRECEDAISRQAVLDETVKKNSIWNSITNSKGENLEEILSQLPSITPQPKTGHWTERKMHKGTGFFLPTCSECGSIQPYAHHTFSWNYCPNCGAKMQEDEE